MPTAPPKVCPGCRQAVPSGRRCATCTTPWQGSAWNGGGSNRRWRNLRAATLRANIDTNDGLCTTPGCTNLATEVHHPDGFTNDAEKYDPANTQPLCPDCHSEETRRQSKAGRQR